MAGITVITPTWQRHKLLLERCIPSVQAQTYPEVEHIVVSDGPDPWLRQFFSPPLFTGLGLAHPLWYFELPEHDPAEHWGGPARNSGTGYASGDLIAYCDDDDSLRPDHCALLAAALETDPAAGFAVSRLASHGPYGTHVVGHGEIACGNVGTPMIMHRREILEYGAWESGGMFEDWDLIWAWMRAGIPWTRADAETCDSWPSAYRHPELP